MDVSHTERLRQLALEKALFRYNLALELHDIDTVDEILRQAETDPTLEEMIFELNRALATEDDDAEQEELAVYTRSEALLAACFVRPCGYNVAIALPDREIQVADDDIVAPFMPATTGDADVAPDDGCAPYRPAAASAPTPAISPAPAPAAPSTTEPSVAVTRALMRATAVIADGAMRIGSYADAAQMLQPILRYSMSRRQRLRVYVLLALCFSAVGTLSLALATTEDALTLAIDLDDTRTLADMLYLRAALNTSQLKFSDAVEDFDDCVAVLREERETPTQNVDLMADIFARRAQLEFYLMRFDAAEHSLDEACRRLSLLDDPRLANASVELARSLMLRLRGLPDAALRHGLASLQLFETTASPATISRVETQIAETALDLAMSLPDGSDRHAFFSLAQTHRTHASKLAKGADDTWGMELAILTRTRVSRLTYRNEARTPALERLLKSTDPCNSSNTSGSLALHAQALTSLGDELALQGSVDAAMNCYRRVLDLLEGSDIPAVGLPARRALHHAREQHTY